MVAVVEETKNHETKELRGARVRLRRFDALDDELGVALARWNASAAELVGLVRRIIDDDCSADWGYLTPERVLTQRCGVDRPTAARLVAVAREIGEYPETFRLFREGQLTLDHVAVIVHRLDPAYEAKMAEAFCQVNIGQARRLALEYPKPVPEPDPQPEPDEPGSESEREPFSLPDPERGRTRDRIVARRHDDGRLRGSFDLGGEVADLFEKTLGVARSRVFGERTGRDADEHPTQVGDKVTWVDALDRLLHAALWGLDPATAGGQRPSDRYQVFLHIDLEHPERAHLHSGVVLNRAERRRLTCDANIRAILERDGTPVAKGRLQRTPDPILRTLVEDRDRGCRICGAPGFLHIHHLVHWEDGGPTDPNNLMAVCTTCHRLIHDNTIRVSGDPTKTDGLQFFRADGTELPHPTPLPERPDPPEVRGYAGPDRSARLYAFGHPIAPYRRRPRASWDDDEGSDDDIIYG